LELNEIRQIIELMEKHGITNFSLRRDTNELKMRKGADLEAVQSFLASLPAAAPAYAPVAAPSVVAPTAAASVSAAPSVPAPVKEEPPGRMINSPMVGTFYAATGPTEPVLVKVGDRVDPDTVVAIIEAMKVMNEIKAEVSGVIKHIIAENGKPVQYGQPLFELQP
jgi:acetyl-CoA carboxylase biotin carboxyl carrier protein